MFAYCSFLHFCIIEIKVCILKFDFPRGKYYIMYLYLDQTVVIYLSENSVGDCSLNMWTRSDTGRRAEGDPVVYTLLYENWILVQKNNWKKKKDKNTVFILKYTCCSLENVLYLFPPSVFYRYFFKKHSSDGSIYLNLTGAIGFYISVICCETLTLT